MVPFGNAQVVETSSRKRHHHSKKQQQQQQQQSIECQHGLGECVGNEYQQCIIEDANHEFDRYWEMIQCLELGFPMGQQDDDDAIVKVVQSCSASRQHFEQLQDCVQYKGPQHQLEYMQMTPPELHYVPWVVVNGRHIDEAHESLKAAVCDAYTGQLPECMEN
eukprot:CAMPEP_0118723380 /NCGR_PEP_ID=MMETSP0800-20121206/31972_1 /TAXON_ID=210618 ORGANISM="Striatella unipunctata, Strain CCMP2910" /NCGR_SAMPLE_ID=MMETSP0800 /ASSEMBLY_ACC=CAM_ASM_000638 /LENGTH=162 /DNA_ID=CAMNT_0006631801 /DNA_START=88 /DNA_END=576 /DNA_ORIENTATION=-